MFEDYCLIMELPAEVVRIHMVFNGTGLLRNYKVVGQQLVYMDF